MRRTSAKETSLRPYLAGSTVGSGACWFVWRCLVHSKKSFLNFAEMRAGQVVYAGSFQTFEPSPPQWAFCI